MGLHRVLVIGFGALATVALAVFAAQTGGRLLADELSRQSSEAIARAGGTGITARFSGVHGWPTRHPVLSGGENLDDATRLRTARAVAAIAGIGAVRWVNAPIQAGTIAEMPNPLHCQDDVNALLRTRTIRFREGSALIETESMQLVNEVAAALRPCLGSIIAITGHTDNTGRGRDNIDLSRKRAEAVRNALIQRGIPADGLRTKGVGAGQPIIGLDPADPANRRIEFSVIENVPVRPTPVDVPVAR